MYVIPGVMSFGLALSNYFQQSFGIYLKYQALVDSHYLNRRKLQSPSQPAPTLDIIKDQQKLLIQ